MQGKFMNAKQDNLSIEAKIGISKMNSVISKVIRVKENPRRGLTYWQRIQLLKKKQEEKKAMSKDELKEIELRKLEFQKM